MAKEKKNAASHKKQKPELPKYSGGNKNEMPAGLPGGFDLPRPCYQAVERNLPAYLWLAGLPLLLSLFMDLYKNPYGFQNNQTRLLMHNGPNWLTWYGLAVLVISLLIGPGLILLQLKAVRGETNVDGLAAFKEGLKYFWRLLGLGILLFVILTISFLFFVIPFFLVLPRVVLAPYFLVDRDMNILDALGYSWDSYKKYHQLWGVFGVWAIIILVSAIPFIGKILSSIFEFFFQASFAIRYEQYRLLDEGKSPRTPIERKLAESK